MQDNDVISEADLAALPLPFQAFALAGWSLEAITPALLRTVEQWCEVLPMRTIAHALCQVKGSANSVEDFRQAMLSAVRFGPSPTVPLDTVLSHSSLQQDMTQTTADAHAASANTRRLIAAQDELEAMTDSEYQTELIKRRKRNL